MAQSYKTPSQEGNAPQTGLEPVTSRLTAERSTIELLRNTAFEEPPRYIGF